MTSNVLVPRAPLSAGLVFGALQLMLGLTWAVYALFLPQLVTAAGLPRSLVPWVLVLDQLIFALTDPWAGAAGDRAAERARQIGVPVACLAAGSGLAFLLLPYGSRSVSPAFLATLLLAWAIGTAALRAPLAALLGRHLPGSDAPHAALIAGGLALAGVGGGLLVPVLRDVSPYAAFAWAGAGTALVALLAIPAERWVLGAAAGRQADAGVDADHASTTGSPAGMPESAMPAMSASRGLAARQWLAGILMAVGMQAFVFIAVPSGFGKGVSPVLPTLFFVGAAVACGLFVVLRRLGQLEWQGALAAAVGALALASFELMGPIGAKAMANLVAGLAWGVVLSVLFTQAFALGRKLGRVGLVVGCLFAALALSSLLRIAANALGLWTLWGPGSALWTAVVCWAGAAGVLLLHPPEPAPTPTP